MAHKRYLGTLYISVLNGTKILDSYRRFRQRRSQISCYRKAVCGADIVKCGGADPCGGKAEPYVNILMVDGGNVSYKVGRTKTVAGSHDPVWKDQVVAVIDTEEDTDTCVNTAGLPQCRPHLKFQVMDDDGGGDHYYADDLLGEATLFLEDLIRGEGAKFTKSMKLPLTHPRDVSKGPVHSQLELILHWENMLISTSSSPVTVPGVYFKRSRGNKVRLYHDAHCEDGDFEAIRMFGGPLHGLTYKAEKCWQDIYDDIVAAKHLVLICGWSVSTNIRLVRKGPGFEDCACPTLGDLLLKKAEQGCTVCVMIWDDVTSLQTINMAKDGLMGTFDEYTRQFFSGTKVHCVVAKRIAGDDQGIMIGPMFSPLKTSSFTHHQKIVLVDTNMVDDNGIRSLTAYVGGLDLTAGRYDTSRHQLHSTLQCEHSEDFYNGCSAEATKELGPREPWHDIHSRIEGPGAWDVYQNYVERLAKEDQSVWHQVRVKVHKCWQSHQILGVDDMIIVTSNETPKYSEKARGLNDTGNIGWSVQVFRSIDTENAVFENARFRSNFNNSKGLMTDKSIQAAYLYSINRSKKFIYIENQYFLGSSQYWLSHRDAPCPHLVPLAITRRINRAIKQNEEYTAYIMTPLFPEGIPTSGTVQEILQWQFQTMQFMYRSIGETIRKYNRKSKPVDYLQFWFPAVREQKVCSPSGASSPSTVASPPQGANGSLTSAYSKFQIYVHSKMLLVDDEWILIGSANINERSMSGGRDSEIAVGLSQDYYVAQTEPMTPDRVSLPKGHVYAFRLQLWQEHFGVIRPEFDEPGSLACSRLLYNWSYENLKSLYTDTALECKAGTSLLPLPYGHACKHPTECDDEGILKPSTAYPYIINTNAPVVGVRSALLPGPLTT